MKILFNINAKESDKITTPIYLGIRQRDISSFNESIEMNSTHVFGYLNNRSNIIEDKILF